MSTTTPRLALRKPDYTDVEQVGLDVGVTMQKIDDLINYSPCTSNTRPANPRRGQLIFETDTGNCLIWTSIGGIVTWYIIANNKFPKGRRGIVTANTNSAARTNGDFLDLSLTFTAEPGRRYIVEVLCSLAFATSPPMPITQSLRWAAGAAVTIAGTVIGGTWNIDLVALSNGEDIYKFGEFVPNVAGNVTVGLFNSKAAGTQTWVSTAAANRKSFLLVRDWGV